MTVYSLDTNVIASHLRDDRFAEATRTLLRRAIKKRIRLLMPDVVYAELYTGIYLSEDPKSEEARVQSLLPVNNIEIRLPRSLKIAKRAGELCSNHLKGRRNGARRFLPDFLMAAQAEASSEAFVTWNVIDYQRLGLEIPVLPPNRA